MHIQKIMTITLRLKRKLNLIQFGGLIQLESRILKDNSIGKHVQALKWRWLADWLI